MRRWLPWILCAALPAACTLPRPTPDAAFLERGKTVYGYSCAACHQVDGKGMEGVGPPLAGSEWITQSDDILTRIVLHGLRGPITVAGKEYNLEMPPMGFLEDRDIAAVLTYISAQWGNARKIDPESVVLIRAATEERSDSWTREELGQ